jgi:hypothetical protein
MESSDKETHLGLAKGTPDRRNAAKNSAHGCKVLSMPKLDSLHHRYDLAA